MTTGPIGVLEKLESAINAHDLEALVACFDSQVDSRQPAHPARDFTGNAQVRQNWAQIFGGVPDIRARLIRRAAQDDSVWAEWAWSGTSRGGQSFEMRGVTILATAGGCIKSVTFYMEPIDRSGANVGASVRDLVGKPE